MNLYIPEIGDKIKLLEPWTFDLYNEDRNATLMDVTNDDREVQGIKLTTKPCTIPAGETLKIDRIYIRKGLSEWSSITFLWVGMRSQNKMVERTVVPVSVLRPHLFHSGSNIPLKQPSYTIQEMKPSRAVRFWVKLEDANKIIFEKV